ncbi:hypothetical protein CGCSCA5_v004498 [Colletotrichum siamense]|nr:hypothetical protein CGCSCA5_v004498 [Colletotrichum siamense]
MGILILSLGTVVTLASVSFLGYLWQGAIAAGATETNHGRLWSLVVFSDWTSRAITVSAAVIRVVLSLQMGVFTAMVASLMIEQAGVPFGSAPLVSLLRAIPASPHNLVTFTNFNLPWRASATYAFAVVVAIILTSVSQFTSTILLSDLGSVNITSPQQSVNMSYNNQYTGGPKDTLYGSKLWHSSPGTYFRFAEHPRISARQSDNLEDTGRILRAFLPFASEYSRMRLRHYHGPAMVTDSRVVCLRPTLNNVTFSFASKASQDNAYLTDVFVRGNLTFNDYEDIADLPLKFLNGMWSFNCVVPTIQGTTALNWQASICSVDGGALNPGALLSTPRIVPGLTSYMTHTFLVFNSTGEAVGWREAVQQSGSENTDTHMWDASLGDLNWISSSNTIWSSFQSRDNGVGMAASACFKNLGAIVDDVQMSSGGNGKQRGIIWADRTASYNTTNVRLQYQSASVGSASTRRGILDLEWKDRWQLNSADQKIGPDHNPYGFTIFSSVADDLPFVVRGPLNVTDEPNPCGTLQVGGRSSRAVHYAHAALFQDTIQTTGSLPETLQAILFILEQMRYYELLPYFNIASPATFVLAEERLIPMRWVGLEIVVGIIVIHLALLITTIVLFLRFTRSSYLGNIWMSLSQVFSPETADIIQKGTETKDDEVESIVSKATTGSEVGTPLRRKVLVKANETNKRKELVLV